MCVCVCGGGIPRDFCNGADRPSEQNLRQQKRAWTTGIVGDVVVNEPVERSLLCKTLSVTLYKDPCRRESSL